MQPSRVIWLALMSDEAESLESLLEHTFELHKPTAKTNERILARLKRERDRRVE